MQDNTYDNKFIYDNMIIGIDEFINSDYISLNTYEKQLLLNKNKIELNNISKIILDMKRFILENNTNFLYIMKIENGYRLDKNKDFNILKNDTDVENLKNVNNECIEIGFSDIFNKILYDMGTMILIDIIKEKIYNKNSKSDIYINSDYKIARFNCEEVNIYTNDAYFLEKLKIINKEHNKEVEEIKKLQYKLEGF